MKIKILISCFFLMARPLSNPHSAQAGTSYEGNSLAAFLGKSTSDNELKGLQNFYNCEMVNDAHYVSKGGIELIFQKNMLNEIHIYKNSVVYGTFKGALPGGLRFGLSSGEVKKLLGKPTVSYSSGYCEFELHDYLLSCWFDGGILSQVGLSVKPGM